MKKRAFHGLAAGAGIVLLAAGLALLRLGSEPEGAMAVLPYVCIGLGCGAFGHGLGGWMSERAVKNSPEIQKRLEIARNDERNAAIANRAKGRAYDSMIYIFGALMLTFALMGVDLPALLLLVAAYLTVVGIFIFYTAKYNREM